MRNAWAKSQLFQEFACFAATIADLNAHADAFLSCKPVVLFLTV